jgi:hypothetical protein
MDECGVVLSFLSPFLNPRSMLENEVRETAVVNPCERSVFCL